VSDRVRGAITVNPATRLLKLKNAVIATSGSNNQLFRVKRLMLEGKGLKQKTRQIVGGFFDAVGFG